MRNLPEVVLSFVDIITLPRDEKDMLQMHSEKPCELHRSRLYTPMGKHIVFLLWPALIQNRQAIVQANCIVGLASPRLEVLKQHQKTCIIWCHTCQTQYTKKMSMPRLKAFQLERTLCTTDVW